MNLPKNPLLASYGGGHAQIIKAIASEMIKQNTVPKVLGFTTAFSFFEREGLNPISVTALLNEKTETSYAQHIKPFLGNNTHPDISQEQTAAYFTIGFQDLTQEYGLNTALELVEKHGRKAFLPIATMESFLRRNQFDFVITTTSPRFELALIRAARNLGIPSLAISDLFLINERKWILEDGYAEHLTVINSILKDELIKSGLIGTKVHVTGNPVFDTLVSSDTDVERRNNLRKRVGLNDKIVILWPSAPVRQSNLYQREFETPNTLVNAFEKLCKTNPNFAYILRPHPNTPYSLPDHAKNGILDPGLSPNDSLLIADVVCTELSTMGLQAALLEKPVICVGFSEEAVYPKYGMASAVETLDEAIDLLKSGKGMHKAQSQMISPPLGTATSSILKLIEGVYKK